jgi:Amt family ammonium transporter
MDFAGGNVVHLSSGTAGLVASVVIVDRRTHRRSADPINPMLSFIGSCLLWVGWFAFNTASAPTAGPRSGYALLNTQISASASALSWLLVDHVCGNVPSLHGAVSGGIAGLVAATPSCGWVNQVRTAVHIYSM